MARPVMLRLFLTLAVIATAIAGNPAQAAPENPRIQSVTVNPNRVDAGATPSAGTVTLSFAPAGNVSVNLRSSNPQAATVPGSVVVLKGQTSATFNVTVGKPSATTTVGITAMLGTSMTGTNLVVQVPLAAKVQSVSLNPRIVAAGGNVLVVVKLNTLAPAGGQQVALNYSPSSLVSGPSSVTVPERAVATEVQVQAGNPANQSTADIKALINNDGFSTTLTIKGSAPITPTRAFINPGRLKSEETGTLTVELSSPAPSGGCSVSLSSSDPSVVTVPSAVTIPAGATTGRASVTVKPVQKSGTITITATLNGGTAKGTVGIVGTR